MCNFVPTHLFLYINMYGMTTFSIAAIIGIVLCAVCLAYFLWRAGQAVRKEENEKMVNGKELL